MNPRESNEPVGGITSASLSEDGREWLDSLPDLIEAMKLKWGLEIDDTTRRGGFNAVVIPAARNGTACVLKLDFPTDQVVPEAMALNTWRGRGAALLLDVDPAHGALLLERLDSSKTLKSIPVDEAAAIAGTLIRRLAVKAPDGLRSLPTIALELESTLPIRQEQLGGPIPGGWLTMAIHLAGQLGPTAQGLLVHGDLHYDNVLAGTREPWLAIDPKPITGDPEYSVPELMWTRADELAEPEDIATIMATLVRAGDLREDVARGWTIVRCLDYWLWGLEHGITEDPLRCERIVKALV